MEAAQSSRKAREGISGQSSREGNETNEVEPGGRTDGCVNNDSNNNEFEPQQRGTGTKFKKQSNAAWKGSSGEGSGSSSVDNKRKADGEHLERPETEDGKWMRMTLHLGAYGMRGCMVEFVSEQDGACLGRTFFQGCISERTGEQLDEERCHDERVMEIIKVVRSNPREMPMNRGAD